MVKCENCELELENGNGRWLHKKGWHRLGRSKKFPLQKGAYWCPDCKDLRDEYGVRQVISRFLPGASESTIQAVLSDIELEKLRRN